MPSKKRRKQRALVIGLIFLGILLTAFFGMRALHAIRKFDGHRPPPPGKVETDVELIRDWMTVPFIGRMYHVPAEIIFEALNISPNEYRDKSLKEINQEAYPDTAGYVLDIVKTTILAHQPPPPPDSAPATVSTPTATAVP